MRSFDLSFLADCLDELSEDCLEQVAKQNLRSLLFFPGFCFVQGKYIHRESSMLQEISMLEPRELLSLWIYQYVSIINHYLLSTLPVMHPISIAVTGRLGGLAPRFVRLLKAVFSPRATVAFANSPM
jgi:hypothetical protein